MKKILKLKKGDIIKITWVDAITESNNNWMPLKEYEAKAKIRVATLGHFMSKDKDFIYIVADRFYEDKKETAVNRLFAVPVGCIIKIRRLK